jgi:hypothetical protein
VDQEPITVVSGNVHRDFWAGQCAYLGNHPQTQNRGHLETGFQRERSDYGKHRRLRKDQRKRSGSGFQIRPVSSDAEYCGVGTLPAKDRHSGISNPGAKYFLSAGRDRSSVADDDAVEIP